MGKLDTDSGPLSELVKTGKVFVVPDYQRSYSWKARKQVAELWGDISRIYASPDEDGDGELDTHFIGSVVTGSGKAKALGPTEVPIIDGQQRMITLSITLAAIRDVVIAVQAPQAVDQVTREYLMIEDGANEVTRVQPGVKDRLPFSAIILNEEKKDSRSPVTRAYQYIVDQLRQGPGEELDPDEATEVIVIPADTAVAQPVALDLDHESDEELDDDQSEAGTAEAPQMGGSVPATWDWERLLTVVTSQLELVSIADVPDDKAYQIFASLNSTGLPLSQVDLVRNAIFMLLGEKEAKVAHQKVWSPLEETLGKSQLESYLHTWVIRKGHNVPAKDMYQRMLRELRAATTRDTLDQLFNDAWAFAAVTVPSEPDVRSTFATHQLPKPLIGALERLRSWGNTPLRPVLLEVLIRYRAKGLTEKEAEQVLSWLESFVVRRYANQVPPNDLRSVFARIAAKLSQLDGDGLAFCDALKAELLDPKRRWPSDTQLKKAFREQPMYRQRTGSQTFFVLKRLAEGVQGRECPDIVYGRASTEYSIEHVLPQNPAHWLADLKAWGDPDPAETIELYTDTIGNLTLTAYNSELSNSSFAKKSEWIAESLSLKMTTKLIKHKQWTRTEIGDRSDELWTQACKMWPRP